MQWGCCVLKLNLGSASQGSWMLVVRQCLSLTLAHQLVNFRCSLLPLPSCGSWSWSCRRMEMEALVFERQTASQRLAGTTFQMRAVRFFSSLGLLQSSQKCPQKGSYCFWVVSGHVGLTSPQQPPVNSGRAAGPDFGALKLEALQCPSTSLRFMSLGVRP
jgi:hypothetical protein